MKKIIALLLVASQSWSAIALVQCDNNYPYSAVNMTTTAGNMLVVATSYAAASNRNDTITDGSSSYVHPVNLHASVNGIDEGLDLSYALNVSGGAKTIQLVASSGDDIGITVCEFSGVGSFDTSATKTSPAGATATPTFDAFTTAGTGLIVAYYANQLSGSEASAGTGYTIDANRSSSHYDALQYDVDAAGGSNAPSFTVTSNNNWILGAMAFTTAGGGGGGSTPGSITTIPGTGVISTIPGTGVITSVP